MRPRHASVSYVLCISHDVFWEAEHAPLSLHIISTTVQSLPLDEPGHACQTIFDK